MYYLMVVYIAWMGISTFSDTNINTFFHNQMQNKYKNITQ